LEHIFILNPIKDKQNKVIFDVVVSYQGLPAHILILRLNIESFLLISVLVFSTRINYNFYLFFHLWCFGYGESNV